MIVKNHLAEIKCSDFDAILSGLKEVIRQDGEDYFISHCIAQMEQARTPDTRAFMLDFISAYLEFSFLVAIILQLGVETYKGFEGRFAQLETSGWMGEVIRVEAPFIRFYLLGCETRGQKSQAVQLIKVMRSTFFSMRKALALAGIQDNYETLLESAREKLAHP